MCKYTYRGLELKWGKSKPRFDFPKYRIECKQNSHTGRNRFNLFHISFSANTADAHPGVSKDQKFCEKFKNTHCQVDHPTKIE